MTCGSSGRQNRRSNPPRHRWQADFETTTDPADCRVWAWFLTNIDDEEHEVEHGIDMLSFIERIARMNAQIYFHNLNFDGRFIIDWLMRNGYRHYSGDGRMMKGEYQTLISNDGKWYTMTVRWNDTGNRTEFRDSLKKLPMPVADIAKAFHLEESKGSIDYRAERPVGHELTLEEIEYGNNDVIIPARALRQQLNQGMNKLTVGADSLNEYKMMFGRKDFERIFPVLSMEMDTEIRRAYRGGWVYADVRYRGKIQCREGKVFDVNSLYPSVMYDRILPFDYPVYHDGGPDELEGYPLYITAVTFTAKLKPGHLPCIQIKNTNVFAPTVYQTEILEPVTLVCTNVDLALWQEQYDMDILCYDGTWYFRGTAGLFNEFIDKWMHIKAVSRGGLRQIAKLQLNSLYGKFATNPNVTSKFPVMEDNIVKLKTGPLELRDPVYTPMGVFITSYARDVTIRAAQANYDTFAYADTDSLHLLTETDPDLRIHPTDLGAWKHEMDFTKSIYVRPKVYSEFGWDIEDGERVGEPHMVTHIAGLPKAVQHEVTFEDYFNGHVFTGKLTPKVVPGGVVLVDVDWRLSDDSLAIVTPGM